MSFKASAVFWTIVRGQPIEAEPVVRLHAKAGAAFVVILLASYLLARYAGARYEHAGPLAFGLVLAGVVYLTVSGFGRLPSERHAESLLARHALVVGALALALLGMAAARVIGNPSSRWSPVVPTLATFYAIRLCQRTWLARQAHQFWVRHLHWFGLCAGAVVELAVLLRMTEHLD